MAENSLLEKLGALQAKYDEIGTQLGDPEVIADMKKYVQLNKDYKELEPVVAAGRRYRKLVNDLADAKNILLNEKDEDLAAIFAGDLFRMYTKYFERKGWKCEVTNVSEGAAGGYKEIVCKVSGEKVYGTLKYESGVHRVQRVPQTETQGRVHTSAASVAVLPEADEFDVEIDMKDVRKDLFCSSGPGGQGVNTTYSAVRLTHIPSGIVVQCQDERSQLKNLDKAMAELRTRLYNLEYEKYLNDITAKRKTMVSTGDRSAKIRTYNYPQSRVTDHRIGYTMYNLPVFMDGDIQEVRGVALSLVRMAFTRGYPGIPAGHRREDSGR